jgi:hypothetical protein
MECDRRKGVCSTDMRSGTFKLLHVQRHVQEAIAKGRCSHVSLDVIHGQLEDHHKQGSTSVVEIWPRAER